MKIRNITKKDVSNLLNSNTGDREDYKPVGLFLHYDNNVNVWVAVDNSTGCAWTEEFKTKKEAINFLKGTGDNNKISWKKLLLLILLVVIIIIAILFYFDILNLAF
jgi:hypothetical protein